MLDNASNKNSVPKNGDLSNIRNPQALPFRGSFVPATPENVDIFRLLDQLEELPEKAKHIRFLRTMIGFDEEQFYMLLLKIRANMPEDLKRAQRLARDTERIADEARDAAAQQVESGRAEAARIIAEAKAEAERILAESRQQAAKMVEQSEVYRMASAQAQEIIRRAEIEAAEIRKGADEYARDVLANMEMIMGKALVTVQHGRQTLERSRK